MNQEGKKISGFGAGELLSNVLDGLKTKMSGGEIEGRDDVFRDEFNDIIIDTVCAFDTHIWETGICRDSKWIIVSQYDNREEAKNEHKKWVKIMKDNPKYKLVDINLLNGVDVNE